MRSGLPAGDGIVALFCDAVSFRYSVSPGIVERDFGSFVSQDVLPFLPTMQGVRFKGDSEAGVFGHQGDGSHKVKCGKKGAFLKLQIICVSGGSHQ